MEGGRIDWGRIWVVWKEKKEWVKVGRLFMDMGKKWEGYSREWKEEGVTGAGYGW